MADTPAAVLRFTGACPDCGGREVAMPEPLPALGDDFDWLARDYDGIRLAMLTELIGRFPERSRWTPADVEVALVEVLAAVLDQLSDMLDRVTAEAYLETARRPESVRRLLALIGYDAAALAGVAPSELERSWLLDPHAMDDARRAGPRAIRQQRRMVTVDDYARRLEEHPLVLRAHASSAWTGSWTTISAAVIAWDDRNLDQPAVLPADVRAAVDAFARARGLPAVDWDAGPPTIRELLRGYVDAYRMATQDVALTDAVRVGVTLSLSVRVAPSYFASEVRRAVEQALGTGPGGFFRPGRLRFGEDLHASDVIATLMALEGVENVCLNRFKRIGNRFPDQVESGRIVLSGLEVAVCDNRPGAPERGYLRLTLHGGQRG